VRPTRWHPAKSTDHARGSARDASSSVAPPSPASRGAAHHRRSVVALVCVVVSLLSAAVTLTPAARAGGSKANGAVIDDWWVALWAAVLRPTASPTGANDWLCTPTAEHPRPVVLIHGTYSNMYASFSNLAAPLRREGYCVYAFNYGDWPLGLGVFPAIRGLGPVRRSARQLSGFVERVRAQTGAAQVDLVGYSQGGVVARTYLRYEGGANTNDPARNTVGTVVGLASANEGSTALALTAILRAMGYTKRAHDVLGPSSRELLLGSTFLSDLNAPTETEPGVRYVNIATAFDEINVPFSRAWLHPGPGATVENVLLQDGCELDTTDHFGLPFNRRTHGLVLRALDPQYTRPIACSAPRIPGLAGHQRTAR
jgi:triacylglycerol esterase/lipase EstA (alpha/beta hydrolase family)